MPRSKSGTPPKYCLHVPSGQAFVTVRDSQNCRRQITLGKHGTPESHAEYARIIQQWHVGQGTVAVIAVSGCSSDLTIAELIVRWREQTVRSRGEHWRELVSFQNALVPLRELFDSILAREFTPKKLKLVRDRMISLGWCRNYTNRQIGRIRHIWKWATEEELIPGEIWQALRSIKPVGTETIVQSEGNPRSPAFADQVEAVLPFVPLPVGTMLQLQALTGMRSGEVRIIRPCDVTKVSDQLWHYTPGSDAGRYGTHKNSWRHQTRVIPLGPQCIVLLARWLVDRTPDEYVFNPVRWIRQHREAQSLKRKSKPTPKQLARMRANRNVGIPNVPYTAVTYPQAVRRACEQNRIPVFQPYDLRHGRKMTIARHHGSEAARAILGQKSIDSTEHYGELDLNLAGEVMQQIG